MRNENKNALKTGKCDIKIIFLDIVVKKYE